MKHLILLCLSVFCLTIMPYTSNSNSVTAPTSISTVDNTPPPVDRNPRKKVKKKKKRKNLNRKNKKNAFRKFFNSSDKTPKQKGTLYIGLAAMFLALGITAMCIIALNSDIGARLMLGIAIVLLAIPFIIFLVLGIKQLKIASSKDYAEKVDREKKEKAKALKRMTKKDRTTRGILLTILGSLISIASVFIFFFITDFLVPVLAVISLIIGLGVFFLGILELILAKKKTDSPES